MKKIFGFWLRKNEKIHCILKTFHQLGRADFRDYVLSYRFGSTGYNGQEGMSASPEEGLLRMDIHQCGRQNEGNIVYMIPFDTEAFGFCSQLTVLLNRINVADRLGMMPCVDWYASEFYKEEVPVHGTTNIFEYYFEPVGGLTVEEAKKSCFVVYDDIGKGYGFDWVHIPLVDRNYQYTEADLERYAQLMKKYIHIRPDVWQTVHEGIEKLFQGKKVLGVHGRGGDMKLAFAAHAIHVSAQEYIQAAEEGLKKTGADYVFLGTDDREILEAFQAHFGDRLLYYKDVVRSAGRLHNCLVETQRPLHHYRLGLEILRDVYTLASCCGFISGLSYINCVVRFVKKTLGSRFAYMRIIDKGRREKGINVNDPQFLIDKEDLLKRLKAAQMDESLDDEEKQRRVEEVLSDFYDS